jgi:hypothetical protein
MSEVVAVGLPASTDRSPGPLRPLPLGGDDNRHAALSEWMLPLPA